MNLAFLRKTNLGSKNVWVIPSQKDKHNSLQNTLVDQLDYTSDLLHQLINFKIKSCLVSTFYPLSCYEL